MIKWTYKQIKLFRWKYIFYIGCIIVYTLISLLTPIIGKYIIDILIPNKQLKMLVGISCVWLVVECFRMQIPLHRITDSASNGSVFPVVTEHFSASSDHAFL